MVLAGSTERVEALNAALWTYDPGSFLPHGSAADGNAGAQPVWLTTSDERPNGATFLVLTDGMQAADLGSYERCLDLFDGNDESARQAARRSSSDMAARRAAAESAVYTVRMARWPGWPAVVS